MGKRGPKPKSAEQKRLEGNPGNRKIPPEGVDVSSKGLNMPTRLTPDEREVWRHLMKAFPSWWFSKADRDLLMAYCRAQARLERAEKELRGESLVSERGNGGPCRNPLLDIIDKERAAVTRLSETLHLTRERRKSAGFGPAPQAEAPVEADESATSGQAGSAPPNLHRLIPTHRTVRSQ